MQLELYSGDKFVCKIENDDALLGSYPIETGMRIHVLDNILFDKNVEKFELTAAQYESREDSLKSFLQKNKLGKYNDEEMKIIEQKRKDIADKELENAKLVTVGSRCKVSTAGHPTRLGVVMYNGELDGKKGIFIGIKFDEPLGNHDGTLV